MTSVWDALARTPAQARAAGVRFLLERQGADGLWADFQLAPGLSDEWVTGYVGDRIADVAGTDFALQRAWSSLVARRDDRDGNGWGYNVHVPQDADSTTWALRLAQRLGHGDEPAAIEAVTSLAAFVHADGLLGTYGPTADIARFIDADPGQDFRGWTAGHACVTAAAAGLAGLVDPEVLLRVQRPDGRWRSYWWASDTFATALAVEVLTAHSAAATAVDRAGEWATRFLQSSELSAFETANLLLVTAITGRQDATTAREALRHLTFTMLPDGSWAPGAELRVPHPQDTDPDAVIDWIPGGRVEGAIVLDLRRIFTTATVVHALDVALREGVGG
jgi:squalene-hopene/tetraprenyl-beta-curcumene cyclase